MTTPNGQHHDDPNGSSQQATSTVLALDGWGPVVAEPSTNGSNGSEPEVVFEEPAVEPVEDRRGDWRERVQSSWRQGSWKQSAGRASVDPQLIRLIAPLAAMTIAVIAALKLGDLYLQARVPEPASAPPSRLSIVRRQIALVVDPSLTPVVGTRPVWERWLDSLVRLGVS